ncbi:MAG TPA: hypothetical protein VEP90_08720 [Methylomirabilota bacterium]|nr:hypothetical protein [Methylomirabilota bacterium]
MPNESEYRFLEFLFFVDAWSRESRYAWNDQQYIKWFLMKAFLYIGFYPIMLIWDWKQKVMKLIKRREEDLS